MLCLPIVENKYVQTGVITDSTTFIPNSIKIRPSFPYMKHAAIQSPPPKGTPAHWKVDYKPMERIYYLTINSDSLENWVVCKHVLWSGRELKSYI